MDELKQPALAALRERPRRATTPSRSTGSRSTRSRTRPTGTSRASSGGATSSRSGTARTATSTVAETDAGRCAECGSTELERDDGRARHVVLVGALAVRDARLARRHARPRARFYPGDLQTTAREIIRLWENRMIFAGLELHGRHPVPRRDHPLDGARARRAADVEEPRDRHRPARRDRAHGADATRYGLLKMSSTQDVRFSHGAIEEGRKLANKLWNVVAADPRTRRRTRPDARPRASRSGGSWRGSTRRARELEARPRGVRLRRTRSNALYHLDLRRLLRLVRRGDQAAALRGDADARATALAALERLLKLLHPVMPHVTEEIWTNLPARESRLIVAPWPERRADDVGADAARSTRVQEAAAIFRRSGVLVAARGRRAADLRGGRAARAR